MPRQPAVAMASQTPEMPKYTTRQIAKAIPTIAAMKNATREPDGLETGWALIACLRAIRPRDQGRRSERYDRRR